MKAYCKGYQYSLYQSLIRSTTLTLSNKGKYGIDYLECQIICENGVFTMEMTDGFKSLKYTVGFNNLKQAMNIGHGWMVALLNERKTYLKAV